ncbi:MAG: hypothetical protein WC243_03345 [Patescibacteria group bacterium]|jgi:hypothetical protein
MTNIENSIETPNKPAAGYYSERPTKVIEADEQYKLVMAITLDKESGYSRGILRCITSRVGEFQIGGTIDKSELHWVNKEPSGTYKIGEKVLIKNEDEMMSTLAVEGTQFLGLEDPDIYYDEKEKLYHLYFTIPFIHNVRRSIIKSRIHLGHAVGPSLDELEMTPPVLSSDGVYRAKEVSIPPVNKDGFRYCLVESSDIVDDDRYSVVRTAKAMQLGGRWEYGDIVFHPAECGLEWIGGHASPGPLLPKDFIDVGEGKLLGFMNGREANQEVGNKTLYGTFSVGLFIYDYEKGVIDWVSPVPFIQDSEAKTITFASQFVYTGEGSGVLYAHGDDSWVRAYDISVEGIKAFARDVCRKDLS